MTKFWIALGTLAVTSACAGGGTAQVSEAPRNAPAETPEELAAFHEEREEAALASQAGEPEETAEDSKEVELVAAMPTVCAEGKDCIPPKAFALATCQERYPGLAIAMFEKSTPWTRLYVDANSVPAVNTHGGASTGDPLEYTEEVILLRRQSQEGSGMQIGGSQDVDVLRWDGSCVTLRAALLSEHRMPTIWNATINWRYLDKPIQQALLESKYVKLRYSQQRKICRGSSKKNPTPACAKAIENLNDAITVAVRGGTELPEPGKLPVWKEAD